MLKVVGIKIKQLHAYNDHLGYYM